MSYPAPKPNSEFNPNTDFGFFQHNKYQLMVGIVTAVASYGLLKKGNWRAAMKLYPSGGGGLNVYKIQPCGKYHRRGAIDYHPIWNKQTKQNEWLLHYHFGKSYSQVKKHRPYEGGWLPTSQKSGPSSPKN